MFRRSSKTEERKVEFLLSYKDVLFIFFFSTSGSVVNYALIKTRFLEEGIQQSEL